MALEGWSKLGRNKGSVQVMRPVRVMTSHERHPDMMGPTQAFLSF